MGSSLEEKDYLSDTSELEVNHQRRRKSCSYSRFSRIQFIASSCCEVDNRIDDRHADCPPERPTIVVYSPLH
jgi:hypothetical protein